MDINSLIALITSVHSPVQRAEPLQWFLTESPANQELVRQFISVYLACQRRFTGCYAKAEQLFNRTFTKPLWRFVWSFYGSGHTGTSRRSKPYACFLKPFQAQGLLAVHNNHGLQTLSLVVFPTGLNRGEKGDVLYGLPGRMLKSKVPERATVIGVIHSVNMELLCAPGTPSVSELLRLQTNTTGVQSLAKEMRSLVGLEPNPVTSVDTIYIRFSNSDTGKELFLRQPVSGTCNIAEKVLRACAERVAVHNAERLHSMRRRYVSTLLSTPGLGGGCEICGVTPDPASGTAFLTRDFIMLGCCGACYCGEECMVMDSDTHCSSCSGLEC